MGKRELLILVVLIVVGAALFRITAPPAPETDEGFSIGRLVDNIRAEIREDSSSATYTHEETIAIGDDVDAVRIGGLTGEIAVTGTDRDDIRYALTVLSTGPDENTALGYAERTVLAVDDLGDVLGFRVSYPPEARQRTTLTMEVPARLAVTLETGSSRSFVISHLQALHLSGTLGEVTAEAIGGAVTGEHSSGRLTVTGAGSVDVALVSTRAHLSEVRGRLAVYARGGECDVIDSLGDAQLRLSNVDATFEAYAGTIDVAGSRGSVTLIEPRGPVRVDTRNTEVEIELDAAVPVHVLTTQEPIRLLLDLDDPPAIVLDAAVSGGEFDVEDVGLEPIGLDDRLVLQHAFGNAPSARVVLRNRSDDIVIRARR